MKSSSFMVGALVLFALALFSVGCDQLDSTTNPTDSTGTGGNGTGLFTTSGSFSFTSDKGNFSAQGVFDTMYTSLNAAGGFRYTEGTMSIIMVFAYNMTNPQAPSLAFAGIADTAAGLAAGDYPFTPMSGSKGGFFGYFPNLADTTGQGAYYVLLQGQVAISSLTATSMVGSFSGSGRNVIDTTKTITVSNGSINVPVVNYFFEAEPPGGRNVTAMQERAVTALRNHLRAE